MSKKKKIFLIISGLILILIILFLLVRCSRKEETLTDENKSPVISIDDNIGDDYENKNETEIKYVSLPGYSKATMNSKTNEINIDFFNPEANQGSYYLKFKLILTEQDETLFESNLVPPGKHISEVVSVKNLNPGEYDAYVDIQPYKWDQATPTNKGEVNIKLIVE